MKKIIKIVTGILVLSSLFVSCKKEEIIKDDCGCYFSLEQAKEAAKKQKKPLLVLVTSNQDEEISTEFVKKVTMAPDFAERIQKDFICCHMDFSEQTYQKTVVTEDATEEEKAVTENLAAIMQKNFSFIQTIGLKYVPAFFLFTKEGYLVTELQPQDANFSLDSFNTLLVNNQQQFDDFELLVKATKKGSKLDKLNAIDSIFKTTPADYQVTLAPLCKEALKLDPKNKTGLVSKFILMDVDTQAADAYNSQNPQKAIELYLDAAKNKKLDPEDVQTAYAMCGYILGIQGSTDLPAIVNYLNLAIEAAPESEVAESLRNTVEYYKNYNPSEEAADTDNLEFMMEE